MRFAGPSGTWLSAQLGRADLDAAVALLQHEYWNQGVTLETIARAQLGASAWVGARDDDGRLVATGRANSDGARHAYVADVAVAKELRGRGVGQALVRLLLDHPRVRGAAFVRLGTADAQPFYERFGFQAEEQVKLPFPIARLLLRRAKLEQGGEVLTHSAPQLTPGAA